MGVPPLLPSGIRPERTEQKGRAGEMPPGLENEVPDALASSHDSEERDVRFMRLALDEARIAFAEDEVPIGAVIVAPPSSNARRGAVASVSEPATTGAHGDAEDPDGVRVLSSAHNRTRAECDPCAHAELLAIRKATYAHGYQRLDGCTLYSTVEPCFMCAGAIVHARLRRVVFGVRDPKFGAAVSLGAVLDHPGANHRATFTEAVCAEESRALLQQFFQSIRKRGS